MTIECQFERLRHLFKLALAPDELGQPALHGEVKVAMQRAGADHLVDVYRLGNSFKFSGT
jgi:hypothetical protein